MPLILALGALVVLHPRWLRGPPVGDPVRARRQRRGLGARGRVRRVGTDGGGRARGNRDPGRRRQGPHRAGRCRRGSRPGAMVPAEIAPDRRPREALFARGSRLLVAFVAALGTWLELSGSLQIARNIASTSNPGNLQNPLRTVQILGTWLVASYKHVPAGGELTAPMRSPPRARRRLDRCRVSRLSECVRAGRLDRPDARGLARVDRLRDDLGRWQGPDADLAGGRAAGVGGRGRAARRRALPAGLRHCSRPRRCCWRSRSPAASPRPTHCSTTAPTSRRRRATKSSLRSIRASPAGDRRCSPTTTNTRSTCSAISTSAAPASCIRRPRSCRPRDNRRAST